MLGRHSLRPVVYHPVLHGLLIRALLACEQDSPSLLPSLGAAAETEYQRLDLEWSRMYYFGERIFWGLFLSDYLQLILFVVRSGVGDRDFARLIVDHVASHPTDLLTSEGATAYRELSEWAARLRPASPSTILGRPSLTGHLPCGDLIDQDEILAWLRTPLVQRDESARSDLPQYATSRERYPRPATRDPVELQEMAISLGVAPGSSGKIDAWWVAVDLAVYRWELYDYYEESSADFLNSIAYEAYAGYCRCDNPEPIVWRHLADLFAYCFERLTALVARVARDELEERRRAEGELNFYAWARLQVLHRGNDVVGWYAFAPTVYKVLSESLPGNLTGAQRAALEFLAREYGHPGGEDDDPTVGPRHPQ
jgi:hypothetical protein